jgi:hypothetical protein
MSFELGNLPLLLPCFQTKQLPMDYHPQVQIPIFFLQCCNLPECLYKYELV